MWGCDIRKDELHELKTKVNSDLMMETLNFCQKKCIEPKVLATIRFRCVGFRFILFLQKIREKWVCKNLWGIIGFCFLKIDFLFTYLVAIVCGKASRETSIGELIEIRFLFSRTQNIRNRVWHLSSSLFATNRKLEGNVFSGNNINVIFQAE